ncbi:MAG TPA: MarR family transcriptional regulator [Pseudonocardiaceae bacterium]|nr:MarR family transcriptional regulator [Pseudonocardiaceae bacterium]
MEPDVNEVAAALRISIGLLRRQLSQVETGDGGLSLPEVAAMARLDRGGPTTAAELARAEQISPQSMSNTLCGLKDRGYVETKPDPKDGRRVVLSATQEGLAALWQRDKARTEWLGAALAAEFDDEELRQLQSIAPLITRLALRVSDRTKPKISNRGR